MTIDKANAIIATYQYHEPMNGMVNFEEDWQTIPDYHWELHKLFEVIKLLKIKVFGIEHLPLPNLYRATVINEGQEVHHNELPEKALTIAIARTILKENKNGNTKEVQE